MDRLSILIEEFASQAFIIDKDRKYHFITKPLVGFALNSYFTECIIEGFNDGIFRFNKPIKTFDSLTISLGDPSSLIEFDQDTFNIVSFENGDNDNLRINFNEKHNLTILNLEKHLVMISGFTTADPGTDKDYIKQVNSPYGIQVNNIVSDYIFEVEVIGGPVNFVENLAATCYLNSRRVILAFEFLHMGE
jgi:hypothetical protein